MLRHRKAANTRRGLIGLSELPWGPAYTSYRSREVYLRYRCLPATEQEELQPYSFSCPPIRPGQTQNARVFEDDDNHLPASGTPIATDLPESPWRASGQERSLPPSPLTSNVHYQSLPSHYSSSDESVQVNASEDLSMREEYDQEMETVVSVRRNARAYVTFKSWAVENKGWIQTCIEFAVVDALFDRILFNIGAPFKAITVKRNLVKYAEFETRKYLSCKPHMLITGARIEDNDDVDHESITCNVCTSVRTTPVMTFFEYLPLKPRIIAWYKSQLKYKDLTSYLIPKLLQRQNTECIDEDRVLEDYFDGQWFKTILHRLGGVDAVKNDLFLSISTDGFQTFENQTYDCWPILALNNNLHPSQRFLLNNVIPLGYIKGPDEPTLLDTFFTPLVEELNEINADGGMNVDLYDHSTVKVRVHILWVTSDKQAKNKLAGLAGQNSKTPCEECCIQGVWCPASKHYYFPSKVEIATAVGRRKFEIIFSIDRLPLRSVDSVEEIWEKFQSTSLTKTEKRTLIRETGVKPKTVLYGIDTIVPFSSFPHDCMHHIMNVSKDLVELLKGENRHLVRAGVNEIDRFVIPSSGWANIDAEIQKIGMGTSLSGFGPPPRPTSAYQSFKAAEWKEFFCSFALVLFEGHIPRVYMKGMRQFCLMVDICRRPVVTQHDLDDLERCAKGFYRHIEEHYYRYDRKRVGIMKSTIHSLLHLRGQVERYGPMKNFNQFWVERRLGDEKKKLHATIRAAESMTERAKVAESFKIFFDEPLARPASEMLEHITQDNSASFHRSSGIAEPLPPCRSECIIDAVHRSYKLKDLMRSYLIRKGDTATEISQKLSSNEIAVYGQLRVPCGDTFMTVGAMKSRRHRSDMRRADWFVSAEYETDSTSGVRQVYYGRILQIFTYTFGTVDERVLLLIDWAHNARYNELGQVFIESQLHSSFRNATVEDASILLNSVGVVEHQGPNLPKRTYVLDPHREAHRLLQRMKPGADGVVRNFHRSR